MLRAPQVPQSWLRHRRLLEVAGICLDASGVQLPVTSSRPGSLNIKVPLCPEAQATSGVLLDAAPMLSALAHACLAGVEQSPRPRHRCRGSASVAHELAHCAVQQYAHATDGAALQLQALRRSAEQVSCHQPCCRRPGLTRPAGGRSPYRSMLLRGSA